ncbi:T9SS sorting signal type C domain-containing protein [Flavobacterium terrigena]|uniref:Calx-beta domain-containing protein n=1 Tax=Flavobacterium terrigena TaxID=402734 RepID=A0A1H6TSS3_9FLAO|nr:T9SS sorting signal type C domain-containing protein [Flavobacterium terrigena]SEI82306.1 Calx-beta domain-containing protein [Flavobacterium terrigena]
MKKNLLFLLMFFCAISFAQIKQLKKPFVPVQGLTPSGHVRCHTNENEAALQAKYPNRATNEEFEAWLAPIVKKINQDRASGRNIQVVYNIPVVIHIVHNGDALGTGENITDAQAISQITVMNQDFRRLAGTPGGTNSTGLAVDCEINFCLAQTDPTGVATTGVVRHVIAPYSNNVTNGSGGADWETNADVEAMKAATQWDPNNYLNMWTIRPGGLSLQNGGLNGLLGYAQFPSNSGLAGLNANGGAANTDGVVAAYNAMGTIALNDGTFILNPTYNLGRTMTHEVGHWVGLRHIWGDDACPASGGNVNTNEDFCADTPAAADANYSCTVVNSCTAIAGNDMIQNYMDYTNDSCMDTFTADQKTRMIAVMTNSPRRNTLNASTACQAPTPIIRFTNPTGSINENTNCSYTDVTFPITIGKVATQNATLTFNVTGGTATLNTDYSIVNSTVTFPANTTASQNLTIRVFHDGIVEPNETLIIDMTLNANGGNAVLNSLAKTMTITIVDNDVAPIATQTNVLLTEDFEDVTGWTIVDSNADQWGVVTGLNGFGTAPNTLAGKCAYSEKDRTYLSGTGNANPNNYIISPQFTITAGATSANLTYIIAGYGADAGNYSAYFTTTLNPTTEAQITSGALIQAATTITSGTSVLQNINMNAYIGQTGHIAFRHNNNNSATGLLLLDTVNLTSVTNTNVQTEINTATPYTATVNATGSFHVFDTNKIVLSSTNNGTFNYGCTNVTVNRSQTSVGAGSASFIDTNAANRILPKTYNITTGNDTATGNYTITLYCTAAEVLAWETATGKSRTALQIIKVINNPISTINASNYTNYIIEEKAATIGAFGPNVTFTATFNTNMSGGYAIGPKTGIVCGDIASTWNGTAWSNGTPSKVTAVTFAGNYSSTADLDACSVTINTGRNVTFNAGHTLISGNAVTVNGTGTLTINNNAALRQVNAVANTGNIIVKRNSAGMVKLDYTAWSSPVSGQQLQAFSPSTLPNRFYQYLYTGTTTPTAYQSVTATNNFVAGKGYMIRAADNWPLTSTVFNGQFTGVPTNGNVSQSVGIGYNLLGNPYASPISGNLFLGANASVNTLYFWTHTAPAVGGVYPVNNYASYTTLGGTASAAGGAIPNGTIQTGQGFFVRATAGGNANFTNAQRVNASVSTQFYRTSENAATTSETDKHRIWLNLNDASNNYNQILVGYVNGATNGIDNAIDGEVLDKDDTMLYNVINDTEYVIQGKGLPFADTDEIALGLKATTAGNYSIALENVDGLFTSQNVYIKDNVANIIHDIKQTPYSFTTTDGVFNNRFKLVFTNAALTNPSFVSDESVVVFTQNEELKISASQEMAKVEVFDILGRNIYNNSKVNDKVLNISSIANRNQALLVKITFTTGQSVTKKVIK